MDNTIIEVGDSAKALLSQARTAIDNEFGPHYAIKNPALVAALVESQTMDLGTLALADAISELTQVLKEQGRLAQIK